MNKKCAEVTTYFILKIALHKEVPLSLKYLTVTPWPLTCLSRVTQLYFILMNELSEHSDSNNIN